ncbi:hypothetical protein H5183_14310 [Pseudoalteromonas sp. SR44-8]|uniref:hypothetical protein n=1 Tax=Pseudoalteromonas sp. SR44-8 TaxID=2760933 RepID=UPI0015FFAFDC|nr:hypothetical protein [Pseudoalteromonas sp. SR44-8]MBB1302514.1 hypothetical protein [Pseudoalteromonas sp. SR44-8]
MKKWIFILISLSFSPLCTASAVYSPLTQPQLEQPDTTLFTRLADFCNRRENITTSTDKDSFVNIIESPITAGFYLHSYNNTAKQTAWRNFYELPARCKTKENATINALWCTEHQRKKRQQFELQWQTAGNLQRAEVQPNDHVYEIILPRKGMQSISLATQNVKSLPQTSLLQHASSLMGIVCICLFITVVILFFSWRHAKRVKRFVILTHTNKVIYSSK